MTLDLLAGLFLGGVILFVIQEAVKYFIGKKELKEYRKNVYETRIYDTQEGVKNITVELRAIRRLLEKHDN